MTENAPELDFDVSSLDKAAFKKLFTAMFVITDSLAGKDEAPWTEENRARNIGLFSDLADSLQGKLLGLDAESFKESLSEVVEELHPTDNV